MEGAWNEEANCVANHPSCRRSVARLPMAPVVTTPTLMASLNATPVAVVGAPHGALGLASAIHTDAEDNQGRESI